MYWSKIIFNKKLLKRNFFLYFKLLNILNLILKRHVLSIFYYETQYMKPVLTPPLHHPTQKLGIEQDITPSFLNFNPGIETFGLYSFYL